MCINIHTLLHLLYFDIFMFVILWATQFALVLPSDASNILWALLH